MSLKMALAVLLAAAFVCRGPVMAAHHGTGVAYQQDKSISLQGTVTDWVWANPHCAILFDVTDQQGNVVRWGAELGNPHQLSSAGFSREVMKPGDKITIFGHPSRNGAPRLQFDHVVLPDGRTLTMKNVKGNGEKADTDY